MYPQGRFAEISSEGRWKHVDAQEYGNEKHISELSSLRASLKPVHLMRLLSLHDDAIVMSTTLFACSLCIFGVESTQNTTEPQAAILNDYLQISKVDFQFFGMRTAAGDGHVGHAGSLSFRPSTVLYTAHVQLTAKSLSTVSRWIFGLRAYRSQGSQIEQLDADNGTKLDKFPSSFADASRMLRSRWRVTS